MDSIQMHKNYLIATLDIFPLYTSIDTLQVIKRIHDYADFMENINENMKTILKNVVNNVVVNNNFFTYLLVFEISFTKVDGKTVQLLYMNDEYNVLNKKKRAHSRQV